jgi:hypothetical protein
MNDGVDVRESSGPSLRPGDIAGDGRRAKFAEFSRRDVRPRQGGDIVSTLDKLSHQRGADRARPAENENTHDPKPSRKYGTEFKSGVSRLVLRDAMDVENLDRLARSPIEYLVGIPEKRHDPHAATFMQAGAF